MLRRHALPVCALAAGALLFAGCSDSDGGSASSEQSAEGLAGDAERFAQAIFDRDAAVAYGYLQPSCQEEMSRTEFTAQLTLALEMAEAFGMDMAEAQITEVATRDVEGDTGEVIVRGEVDGEPMSDSGEWDEWVYEDGRWRTTDCDMGMGEGFESSDDESPDTTVGGDLRPADEAQAERELGEATTADLGETVDLGDGMSATVTAMDVVDASGDPALEVSVRAENRGDDGYSPSLDIRCTGSTEEGTWLYSESTYEPNRDMPSGSFEEGVLVLALPDGGCETPAYVLVENFFSFDGTPAKVRVDDDLVDQLR